MRGNSKSNLITDITQDDVKIIDYLRSILENLRKNNLISQSLTERYMDLNFETLLSDKAFEAYKDNILKHPLYLIIDKQSKLNEIFFDNRIGFIKTNFNLRGSI